MVPCLPSFLSKMPRRGGSHGPVAVRLP